MTSEHVISPNPYVGPRAFRSDERIYGRDRETRRLINLITAERIVLFYSPSGAGKTSLIQATLIPKLMELNFSVLPVARVYLDAPLRLAEIDGFNRYVFSVCLSFEEGLLPEQRTPLEKLVGMKLGNYLTQRQRSVGNQKPEILILDQFEEILTLDPTDQEVKSEFFEQLGEALDNPNRWALFSMREDFVTALDPYLLSIPTRFSNTFRLDLLDKEVARLAVQRPAQNQGIEFEDLAALKLVDDLRRIKVQRPDGKLEMQLGPYIEPVQLQVVAYRLWENHRPEAKHITLADLQTVGDVDQSLEGYYAERVVAIAIQSGVKERTIREWFDRHLITEQGIRGQVLLGPNQSGGLDNRVIRQLEDAHLVRSEKRGGALWFELTHDRLVDPVHRNNATWFEAHLSTLQRQADLWDKQSRPEGLMLREQALEDAIQWAQAHSGELTSVENDFLKVCQEASAREERERIQKEQQLQAAQKLAEAENKRAEEQALAVSRLRRWAIALFLVLIFAVIMAVFAGIQGVQANRSASTAQFAQITVKSALITNEALANKLSAFIPTGSAASTAIVIINQIKAIAAEAIPPTMTQRASNTSTVFLTPTPTRTITPSQTATNTPTRTPRRSPFPSPTRTQANPEKPGVTATVPPPSDTPVPPTSTLPPPTDTPVPPSDTPAPVTDTPEPSTDTPAPPTDTPAPPTDTPVPPTPLGTPGL